MARVPWRDVGIDAAYLIALDASFVVLGTVAFGQRDFKSWAPVVPTAVLAPYGIFRLAWTGNV